MNSNWLLLNHVLRPTCAPHVEVENFQELQMAFKKNKSAVCAVWTSDFDRTEKSNWWYVIKDTPFSLADLKAKRRYEITKGYRNFDVKQLENPISQLEEIYGVYVASLAGYKGEGVHVQSYEQFSKWICESHQMMRIFGCYYTPPNYRKLVGYSIITVHKDWFGFQVLKTNPAYERLGVNAALIYGILLSLNDEIAAGKYLSDGSRTIFHVTAFQDYLEKYFQFRKAYCKLHITYNPRYKFLLQCAYPFRYLFIRMSRFRLMRGLSAMLKMEEIVRNE